MANSGIKLNPIIIVWLIATALLILLTSPTCHAHDNIDDNTHHHINPPSVKSCGDIPIKFATLTWESGQFFTGILKHITELGYGCAVSEIPGATPALETALSQNDIQVIAEQWVGRSSIMANAIENGKVQMIGDTLAGGATQGWYVPKFVIDNNPNLNGVNDLQKFAHLFIDPQNPSKSQFLNCPTGWTCEIFNTRLLKNTHLDNQFNNIHPGTGAALDAQIVAAFERREPLLFYYWQPTGLMAKYDFAKIDFPAYDDTCWQDLLKPDGQNDCVSGFAVSKLAVAVSSDFADAHPNLLNTYAKVQFKPDMLNQNILHMQENKLSGDEQARLFLLNHPNIWQSWLPKPQAQRLSTALGLSHSLDTDDNDNAGINKTWLNFPDWSLEKPINNRLSALVNRFGNRFRTLSQLTLTYLLLPIETLLQNMPALLLIALVSILGFFATRKCWFSVACAAGLYVIGTFGLWQAFIQTLSLLVLSVLITMLFGIPLGILMASNRLSQRIITPVLDVMQTMPSFVYLIPVLMLFGIGKVPALFATVVYALPPLIRLTMLGIQQVNQEIIEAAQSFGSNFWQLLFWVKLPQAMPSIMAGINQAVMMSLSMVVLASMIGAPGLGENVLQSIQTLNIGQGLQAGMSIVIMAIIIDRISQAFGQQRHRYDNQ